MSQPNQPDTPMSNSLYIITSRGTQVLHFGIPLEQLKRIASKKPLFRPPPRKKNPPEDKKPPEPPDEQKPLETA